MKRLWRLMRCLLLVLVVVGCTSSEWKDVEPMSDFEIDRYRTQFYLSMTPAQRSQYESLPTRAQRDAYLRELGALKTKKAKRK